MTFAPASDSSSALHMTKKGGPGNMERIEIRLLVLQQRLEQKRLEFEKIHTDDNETDMLTKPMTAVQEQVPAAARFRAVRREFHQAWRRGPRRRRRRQGSWWFRWRPTCGASCRPDAGRPSTASDRRCGRKEPRSVRCGASAFVVSEPILSLPL
ncbi:unnamed protein product, partial [Prorocentrum cordatum]